MTYLGSRILVTLVVLVGMPVVALLMVGTMTAAALGEVWRVK